MAEASKAPQWSVHEQALCYALTFLVAQRIQDAYTAEVVDGLVRLLPKVGQSPQTAALRGATQEVITAFSALKRQRGGMQWASAMMVASRAVEALYLRRYFSALEHIAAAAPSDRGAA